MRGNGLTPVGREGGTDASRCGTGVEGARGWGEVRRRAGPRALPEAPTLIEGRAPWANSLSLVTNRIVYAEVCRLGESGQQVQVQRFQAHANW